MFSLNNLIELYKGLTQHILSYVFNLIGMKTIKRRIAVMTVMTLEVLVVLFGGEVTHPVVTLGCGVHTLHLV